MAAEGPRAVTGQDRTLYALCRPQRLLDLVRRFTVFEGGSRKIARHPQFFSIREAVQRVKQFDPKGNRKGGVIWHTQGAGKSLTMVMLGRALALDKEIPNPRILIVTDRDDLDVQIRDTFKSCDMQPTRATSGAHLLDLIQDKRPLITTIINKFDSALRGAKAGDADANIFVLVDESCRRPATWASRARRCSKKKRTLSRRLAVSFTGMPSMRRLRTVPSCHFSTRGA